ncbi:MAG: hypothetical protein GWO24_28635, partial [Akkermansiaceae bacterium]|nr:hypothetical protein [Akkermansiaceae bacterium]
IDGFSGALTVGGGGFSITAWITPDVIDTSQFASEWVFAQRSGGVDRSQWGLEEGKLWGGKNDFTGKGTTTLVSG